MRHHLVSFLGSAALSLATIFALSSDASAQHRGGFSGGAYHGGPRGGLGGSTGFHAGGYNHGYRQGPYYSHGGHGYFGYPRYPGYGYGYGLYPGFGITLGIGGLGYGGYNGYYGGGVGYNPGYYSAAPNYVMPSMAYAPAPAPQGPGSARIIVRLPADAKLWIDDYQSTQTGPVRELQTPATLQPGQIYHYTLKATWTANGQPVTQERVVDVQAGIVTDVDFGKASGS